MGIGRTPPTMGLSYAFRVSCYVSTPRVYRTALLRLWGGAILLGICQLSELSTSQAPLVLVSLARFVCFVVLASLSLVALPYFAFGVGCDLARNR